MDFNAFLTPEVFQDTPRLFTAIAEWLAVFLYTIMYKKRLSGGKYISALIGTFLLQGIFQYFAGILPIYFWIPTMIGAVALMYVYLFAILDITPMDCGVLTTHAFVLAEFAASLYRQIYCWLIENFSMSDCLLTSSITMVLVYTLTYVFYYSYEKENIPSDRDLLITPKELFSVVLTGLGAFIVSNLSFVSISSPFSVTDSILTVRTLVDFGGLLMLMTEMGRRNELHIKNEKDSIDQLFHRQYEQYKLAIDNSEALRKEMHDMKHYVAALKNENDPDKRAELMEGMEQAIAIQESFMNTGNQVLDVILTTKSLQCQKQGITLSAMIDGDMLSDIYVKDICSLFGNLLDNAIEATQQIENKDKRLINLSVRGRNNFIIVECENCCEGLDISHTGKEKRHVLPRTTKTDKIHHGYGLKSIAKVAEKYGGGIHVTTENEWFKVKVIMAYNK